VAGQHRGGHIGSVVALICSERRSSAPRWPALSPAAPGRKGDSEGHVDLAVKYTEARLTEMG
jgi:hypothetical protein